MSASPRCGQFALPQFEPHLHDGPQSHDGPHLQDAPQLRASGLMVQLQEGVQLHGLHLQDSVIGKLLGFGLWSSWDTVRIGRALERSG